MLACINAWQHIFFPKGHILTKSMNCPLIFRILEVQQYVNMNPSLLCWTESTTWNYRFTKTREEKGCMKTSLFTCPSLMCLTWNWRGGTQRIVIWSWNHLYHLLYERWWPQLGGESPVQAIYRPLRKIKWIIKSFHKKKTPMVMFECHFHHEDGWFF